MKINSQQFCYVFQVLISLYKKNQPFTDLPKKIYPSFVYQYHGCLPHRAFFVGEFSSENALSSPFVGRSGDGDQSQSAMPPSGVGKLGGPQTRPGAAPKFW